MRDLMECRAEVFRRSEKRIKERRQRGKRLVAVCLPMVCLCVVCLLTLRPDQGKTAAPEFVQETAGESLVSVYKTVTVTGEGTIHGFANASQVLKIAETLERYVTDTYQAAVMERGEVVHDEAEDVHVELTDAQHTRYTIVVTGHDGGEVVYQLLGDTLSNVTTGKACKLTREQREELAALLELD